MLVYAKCGQYSLKPDTMTSFSGSQSSDHLTSKQSCAAYNVNELRDYLSVVKRIKGTLCRYFAKSMY
jgi:hypothetical protein